jgi:hypothetical protein
LKANLVISMNAPGARDTSFRIFRVVEPGLPIRGRSLSGTGEFRLQRRPGGILEIHSVRARGNGFEVFLTTLNGKTVRQARPILSGTSRKRWILSTGGLPPGVYFLTANSRVSSGFATVIWIGTE